MMRVYTDPKLLDVQGALDALPELPLDGERNTLRQAVGAEAGRKRGRSHRTWIRRRNFKPGQCKRPN